jgi:hypothetical protein
MRSDDDRYSGEQYFRTDGINSQLPIAFPTDNESQTLVQQQQSSQRTEDSPVRTQKTEIYLH